jgi:hypothetical protein
MALVLGQFHMRRYGFGAVGFPEWVASKRSCGVEAAYRILSNPNMLRHAKRPVPLLGAKVDRQVRPLDRTRGCETLRLLPVRQALRRPERHKLQIEWRQPKELDSYV